MSAKVLISTLAMAACLAAAAPVAAQAADPIVTQTFVHLDRGEPAVLYAPATPGPKSHIAVLAMHSAGDYLTFSACTELSKRGYTVLCANNSTDKSGTFDDGILDDILLQVKTAVTYLRHVPGIDKVVLLGHSGGATVMTAYQDIAEGGVKACNGPEKIHKCPDSLAGLPVADGVVLADANWGIAEMTLFSIDPAVISETSGKKLNPALDMYAPANGFSPKGSHYSAAFEKKFLTGEGARNTAILKRAQARLKAIEAGQGDYDDDEPFIVPGASLLGGNNKLFSQDTHLLSRTRKAWPLVKADGSVITGIVHTVRVPENMENLSHAMKAGALKTTVKNYLNNYAIRVTPDFGYDESGVHGVDWTSTYASVPGNAEGIHAPLLALGMTGHWEGLAAEEAYDHAASVDKSLAFIEGATHLYTPCKPCEATPGQFGDTVKTTYDYIDGWLSKPGRF